jgi:hypothetical protein
MADLSKIKVGDKLRLELTVTDLDLRDHTRPVEAEERHWLHAFEVDAAEHIPAPRVFKRGDWVRHAKDTPSRYGLVTKVRNGTAALGGLITVSWPDGPAYDYYVGDLEPDEAPE